MPNGLKVIIALLALNALGAAWAVILPYGEISWLVAIIGAVNGVIAIGLGLRNRFAYFCFLALAGIAVIAGFVFSTIIGFTTARNFEPPAVSFIAIVVICLGIWIWAYRYARSFAFQKWYFGKP